jgi:hypothetical protein
VGGGRSFPCRAIAISDAAPGTTCGNHRAHFPRHLRTFPGIVFAVQLHELIAGAGAQSFPNPPYKRGATGSNPVAPTRQNNLVTVVPIRH